MNRIALICTCCTCSRPTERSVNGYKRGSLVSLVRPASLSGTRWQPEEACERAHEHQKQRAICNPISGFLLDPTHTHKEPLNFHRKLAKVPKWPLSRHFQLPVSLAQFQSRTLSSLMIDSCSSLTQNEDLLGGSLMLKRTSS